MSCTTLTASTQSEVEPSSNYTPEYRQFFERLRRARLQRGRSIADMSDEVGLTFKLAYEFETLVTPLPFEWLEVWCRVVDVALADYLAVYWASEEAYAVAKEREREVQERGDTQTAPCITITKANVPALSHINRALGWLSPVRAAFDHIAHFFR